MSNWDDTMLIECATSFVRPLELDVKIINNEYNITVNRQEK